MAGNRLVEWWATFLKNERAKIWFGDQDETIVKQWLFLARVPLAAIGVIGFLIVFIAVAIYGNKVGFGIRFLYALWTFSVPLYFFTETVYGIDPMKAKADKDKWDRFKATQDAARPVWAACAIALSVLLLKSSSGI